MHLQSRLVVAALKAGTHFSKSSRNAAGTNSLRYGGYAPTESLRADGVIRDPGSLAPAQPRTGL